jgi:DNA-binding NarL/FixJ family response regulator
VKTHVAAIYRAFGARNRTEALIAARRAGFDITLY